ncbi:MAG: HAMP domain-containing sensor histidine kinase [Bacteroidaceae bacterium]|nr:HAMP domain-containing sensor histidine kinase [Bacteroidaceae bacterium]
MQWTDRIRQVKIVLVLAAVFLVVASLAVSQFLVSDLKEEEQRKMGVWAQAMRTLNNADEDTDLSLVLEVLNGNHTIPVIVLDRLGNVQDYRNLAVRADNAEDSLLYIKDKAQAWQNAEHSIRIDLSEQDYMEICYGESLMLIRLAWWPYVQLGVVLVFVLIAIFALLSSKKAEQNKVWVGLSKETAHQLGTPISSLMAWVEVLKDTYPDDELIPELGSDVKRLQRIAERFSKIGSKPEIQPENLNEVVTQVLQYIGRRTSNRVSLVCNLPQQPLIVPMNAPLFEWVVENLCKNAVDSMDGDGTITLTATDLPNCYALEVADTGKGIAKNHFQTIFMPGFTTKKRGWGLGLSLAKRIIEDYHQGHIFVKNSELGKGTTFRIELKKH